MPTIYRIERSDGSTGETVNASLAGAVIIDSRRKGEITPDGYQALLIGHQIKPLPHPVEWSRLREYKQTYLSASIKGILLRVERRVCLRCGHIFDAPRIVFGAVVGCLPSILVCFIGFILMRFVFGMTTRAALAVALMSLWVLFVLLELAGALYIRLRFSERQAAIAQRRCQACGADDSIGISRLAGKRVQIGDQGKWIHISVAGKS